MEKRETEITEDMVATSSMQCLKCGKHLTENSHYFKIQGNIFVGELGGIIGRFYAPTQEPKELPESRFCMNCLIEELSSHVDSAIIDLKNKIAQKEAELASLTKKNKISVEIPDFLPKGI